MDWTQFGTTLLASAVGGLLGGVLALRGTDKAIDAENSRRGHDEVNAEKQLLTMLAQEISQHWKGHQSSFGKHILALPEGAPYMKDCVIRAEVFPIFRGNVGALGKIKDDAIRKLIVKYYTRAETFMECIRANTAYLREFEVAVGSRQGGLTDTAHHLLVEHAAALRTHQAEVAEVAERIITEFEKQGYEVER